MSAIEISRMIKKVTRRTISSSSILSTAAAMLCKGTKLPNGTKRFNSDEIAEILRYYEFNPVAFEGKG